MSTYHAFLESKADTPQQAAIRARSLAIDALHPFQVDLVEWAFRVGRGGVFADCGLGKTPMQLVWADSIVRETNRPVLILTPLAVSGQTLREAAKFRVEACRYATHHRPLIHVTNYEQLHRIEPSAFAGIVCDESSILKNFDGVRRGQVTEALRRVPYRLLCTATAAPNDYIELGTSSEALGGLGYMDMLSRFFVNDQHSSHPNRLIAGSAWRFRGHAAEPFWRWIATWARACRRPSDLGFADDGFQLPPITFHEHVISASRPLPGQLFARPATTMPEERQERRLTLNERCAHAAALVDHDRPAVIWCHLNAEGDQLAAIIPDARQVSGTDTLERKEEVFAAFASGACRVLVVKPKIGAWGLNWQHCAHVVMFATHSYEQYYQAVRRCYRFGQQHPVTVDVVLSEGEQRVLANLQRKAAQADAMFDAMLQHMQQARALPAAAPTYPIEVPQWLAHATR